MADNEQSVAIIDRDFLGGASSQPNVFLGGHGIHATQHPSSFFRKLLKKSIALYPSWLASIDASCKTLLHPFVDWELVSKQDPTHKRMVSLTEREGLDDGEEYCQLPLTAHHQEQTLFSFDNSLCLHAKKVAEKIQALIHKHASNGKSKPTHSQYDFSSTNKLLETNQRDSDNSSIDKEKKIYKAPQPSMSRQSTKKASSKTHQKDSYQPH